MPDKTDLPEDIQIEDLSHDGRGVGRLRGKACFVAGALPGELVRWRRLRQRGSYDEGELIEVVEASPDRINPECQHYSGCGGCQLLHLTSEAQLRWKQAQLQSSLISAKLPVESWLSPLTAEPFNYRRRTRLAVTFNRVGEAQIGFRRRGGKQIEPIRHCQVLDPRLNRILPMLQKLARQYRSCIPTEFELSAAESTLAVCIRLSKPLRPGQTMAELPWPEPVQLWCRIADGESQPLDGSSSEALSAPLQTRLTESIHMRFKPGQFIQVNARMNSLMIEQALTLLEPQAHWQMLDLFAGVGNFSLAFAPYVNRVMGVEGEEGLCEQARNNSQTLGFDHLSFKALDLFQPQSFDLVSAGESDLVILDPPRAGASELCKWLANQRPARILYVSCHPATLVRDLQLLRGHYQIRKMGVMNMFPQTTHLEAMAVLSRNDISI